MGRRACKIRVLGGLNFVVVFEVDQGPAIVAALKIDFEAHMVTFGASTRFEEV